jgi:N-acetylglucosamine-6-phosphate deacetylase
MNVIATDALTGQPMQVTMTDGHCVVRPTEQSTPAKYVISPGWVDIQVNGFAGHDFNSPSVQPSDVITAVRRLWQEGVTHCLPTVITQSEERMAHSLRAIARACADDAAVRSSILGVHLEGPCLSPVEGARGAHPLEHIRPPDWEEFLRLQAAAGGMIRLVTLAPEVTSALPFIAQLRCAGIVVAIGHTLADGDELVQAVAAGATLSTHLGNGAPSVLPRHPNVIWEQLAQDRLFASAIFDGHHLPASVMKTLVRAKGVDKLILTSDAAALARMPPGVYHGQLGGTVELRADGRLVLVGTPYLAGSASSLRDGVENAVRLAGCPLGQACRMASLNPLRALGLSNVQDSFTLFAWDAAQCRARIIAAVVAGRVRWQDD